MKTFSMVPSQDTQIRLNRIVTPYNNKLVFKKHMEFHRQDSQTNTRDQAKASKDKWADIFKLVLNDEPVLKQT